MTAAPGSAPAKVRLFRLRQGQVGLILVLLLSIIGLGMASYLGFHAQTHERATLASTESAAITVSITQRDSLSLAYTLSQWGSGLATTKDVRDARAVLQERLDTVDASGQPTIALTSATYQEALTALDEVLLGLRAAASADRAEFLAANEAVTDQFVVESGALTESFQELIRAQVEQSAASALRFQVIQNALVALIVILFLTLVIWIAGDIRRRYVEAAQRLNAQRQLIDISRQRLDLRRGLDDRSEALLHRVREGLDTPLVISAIEAEFAGILPGLHVAVRSVAGSDDEVEVNVTSDSTAPLPTEDVESIVGRVREIVRVAHLRDQAALEVSYQREHDPITGLPNQVLFLDELAAQLSRTIRASEVCAITIITIDRFREIQNSLGHARADALMITVADDLRGATEPGEFVARLTSEEFAIVARYPNVDVVTTRARTLVHALGRTQTLGDVEVRVSVSAGIATSTDATTAQDMMNHGAIAMYLARQLERGGFVVYQHEEHSRMSTLLHEELAVTNALRLGEFRVFYQPIVSLSAGVPVGFEALARWQRPDVGLVFPGQFLGTIKRAGLTNEFGEWVMDDAIRGWARCLLPHLREQGATHPYLTINVDAPQVEDPNFTDLVLATITRHDVPNDTICLEITEHELAAGHGIPEKFATLRNAGLRIALDDFGTGYSTLGQLRDLPLDIVKIDRSFLPDGDGSSPVGGLVADIHQMAVNLGLSVVAEGVETGDVARQLRAMGIGYAQGNVFGLPSPEPDADAWLSTHVHIDIPSM